jgi:hypothetical protein
MTQNATQNPPQDPEFFTVRVHNYKDDGDRLSPTMHGVYTRATLHEAEAFVDAVVVGAYPDWDFFDAEIVPLHAATIPAVAKAQSINFLPEEMSA